MQTFILRHLSSNCTWHNSGLFLFFLLQDEKDFRDKLSPIHVSFNYTLDPNAAADSHGLRPILNNQTKNVMEQKVFWPASHVHSSALKRWS